MREAIGPAGRVWEGAAPGLAGGVGFGPVSGPVFSIPLTGLMGIERTYKSKKKKRSRCLFYSDRGSGF